MKPILRDIALLLLVLVPFELWINVEWQRFMGAELEEYRVDMARPTVARTRVVVLGDSHTRNAFLHAALPDSVVELAYGAESLREVHLKLRTLLRRGIRPRCVVLQADPHGFSPYRDVTNNEQTVVLGANLQDYNEVYDRTLSGIKKAVIDRYPLAEQQNRAALTSLLMEKYLRRGLVATPPGPTPPKSTSATALAPTEQAGAWAAHSSAERLAIATGRLQEQFAEPFVVSPGLRETWQQIIALCRARHIRVVAVRYPVSNEYRAGLAHYDLRGVAATLRAFPPDTLLDYSATYAAAPRCFMDSDHLGAAGSAAFAPRILADLRAVLARPAAR